MDNIREAFTAYQAKVKELRDKHVRFAGHDLGNQLIGVAKLREIPERFRTLKNARTKLKRSPMGMLFKHKT